MNYPDAAPVATQSMERPRPSDLQPDQEVADLTDRSFQIDGNASSSINGLTSEGSKVERKSKTAYTGTSIELRAATLRSYCGCENDELMVALRALFDEQNDRIAKVVEETMEDRHERLFERMAGIVAMNAPLATETKTVVRRTSLNSSASCYDEDRERVSAAGSIDSTDRGSFTKARLSSRMKSEIDLAVQNFNMQEKEDDDLYARAQDVATTARQRLESRRTQNLEYIDISAYPWRQYLRDMLLSMRYEMSIGLLILLNAVFMGFELQYMVDQRLQDAPLPLAIVNHTFNAIFVVELLLRIVAEGPAFINHPTKWAWNWTDSILVIFALLESAVDIYQSYRQDVGGGDGGVEELGSMKAIRVIRITRLLRIFRVARIVRFVRALRTLIYSIVCTLKSLAWATLLLLIIIYVFGLVFTQAVGDYLLSVGYDWADPISEQNKCGSTDPLADNHLCVLHLYWGGLPSSMLTIFKAVTGGISWDIAVQPLRVIGIHWELVFVFYISFTYLAVLNVVTGVFCQSAIEGAQHDHDLAVQAQIANKNNYIRKIKDLFQKLDEDGSGCITFNELTQHIEDPKVVAFFDSIELNTSDAWTLFKMLDNDNTQEIDINEFVDGVLRLRGVAKSIDLAKLMYETKWTIKSVKNLANYVHLEMSRIHQKLGALPTPDRSTTRSRAKSVTVARSSPESSQCSIDQASANVRDMIII